MRIDARPYLHLALRLAAVTLALSLAAPSSAQSQGDAMLETLRRKVSADPHHADSWRSLGRLHRKRGETDVALLCFARAVELDPESPAANFDLAETLASQNRSQEAAYRFRRVAALAPESSYAWDIPAPYRSAAGLTIAQEKDREGEDERLDFLERTSPAAEAPVEPTS